MIYKGLILVLPDKQYTVVGERLVRELNGEPCSEVEELVASRKSIQMGRSFSRPINLLSEMEQAVATYVSRLAEKLRQQNLYTYGLRVYMRNSPYHQDFHYQTLESQFLQPIHDTQALVKSALALTKKIFKTGRTYHKAGVIAYPLTSHPASKQILLFTEEPITSAKNENLSGVLDQLNQKYGAGTLRYAVCGIKPSWSMRADHKSPAFTTQWKELMKVKG